MIYFSAILYPLIQLILGHLPGKPLLQQVIQLLLIDLSPVGLPVKLSHCGVHYPQDSRFVIDKLRLFSNPGLASLPVWTFIILCTQLFKMHQRFKKIIISFIFDRHLFCPSRTSATLTATAARIAFYTNIFLIKEFKDLLFSLSRCCVSGLSDHGLHSVGMDSVDIGHLVDGQRVAHCVGREHQAWVRATKHLTQLSLIQSDAIFSSNRLRMEMVLSHRQ